MKLLEFLQADAGIASPLPIESTILSHEGEILSAVVGIGDAAYYLSRMHMLDIKNQCLAGKHRVGEFENGAARIGQLESIFPSYSDVSSITRSAVRTVHICHVMKTSVGTAQVKSSLVLGPHLKPSDTDGALDRVMILVVIRLAALW